MHPKNEAILAAAAECRNARITLRMAQSSAEQAREHLAKAEAAERYANEKAETARAALLALADDAPFDGEGDPCEKHPGNVKHLCLGFVGCDECEREMFANDAA